jgi:hypothetical protein
VESLERSLRCSGWVRILKVKEFFFLLGCVSLLDFRCWWLVETAADHVPIRVDQTRHKADKDKKPWQKKNN